MTDMKSSGFYKKTTSLIIAFFMITCLLPVVVSGFDDFEDADFDDVVFNDDDIPEILLFDESIDASSGTMSIEPFSAFDEPPSDVPIYTLTGVFLTSDENVVVGTPFEDTDAFGLMHWIRWRGLSISVFVEDEEGVIYRDWLPVLLWDIPAYDPYTPGEYILAAELDLSAFSEDREDGGILINPDNIRAEFTITVVEQRPPEISDLLRWGENNDNLTLIIIDFYLYLTDSVIVHQYDDYFDKWHPITDSNKVRSFNGGINIMNLEEGRVYGFKVEMNGRGLWHGMSEPKFVSLNEGGDGIMDLGGDRTGGNRGEGDLPPVDPDDGEPVTTPPSDTTPPPDTTQPPQSLTLMAQASAPSQETTPPYGFPSTEGNTMPQEQSATESLIVELLETLDYNDTDYLTFTTLHNENDKIEMFIDALSVPTAPEPQSQHIIKQHQHTTETTYTDSWIPVVTATGIALSSVTAFYLIKHNWLLKLIRFLRFV